VGTPTIEHTLEGWNKVIDLNATAMFLVTQEVGCRCMLPRRHNKIINITSIQGLTGSLSRRHAIAAAQRQQELRHQHDARSATSWRRVGSSSTRSRQAISRSR
jgi:NAD(P)-dependent dehydrogenase (short-subunit alcohol dehydrogenase family)